MYIRFADLNDFCTMHEILEYYIKSTAVLFTDVVPNFDTFKDDLLTIMKEYPVLVAENNGEVVAFAYARRVHDGKAYDFTVESTIYVKKEFVGNGIGTELYDKLEYILIKQNVVSINAYIAVTDENDPYLDNKSKIFHEKHGFVQTAYFKYWGYKFNKWYDSIWMTKKINNISLPAKKFIPINKLSDLTH
ncbi:GNAT family N-acetyltransferase [Methanosphaera sp.]|uniref:GNAT family N-acetyltransferase n=1 Tax=Methanosphaera sp. TaxID=2666342 RepID=UPI0025ECFD34|nr:GNAT family N-acetyltransferase [Methanosphaera sp.]